MHLRRFFFLALIFLTSAFAAEGIFPGLRSVLTDAEWKRAGLDRLSPDQVGVIDAAIISHYMRAVTGVGPLPSAAALTAVPRAAPVSPVAAQPPAAAKPPESARGSPSIWERFGLSKGSDSDWRKQPPLLARCTGWQGGNRFVLDNGQVWEGLDSIPFELEGKQVIIEARPLGGFALKLDEKSAVIRVQRVK